MAIVSHWKICHERSTPNTLPVDARRLYARLFLRKHAWLKCETLGQNYAEVEDVAGAVRELVAVRLLEDGRSCVYVNDDVLRDNSYGFLVF